jgi:serpin B
MMTLKKKLPYGTTNNNNAEWISIPYNSSDSMVVILPRENVGIDAVLKNFNADDIINRLDSDSYANVNLSLPKFKVESTFSLVSPLQQMGVRELFTQGANLRKLSENGDPIAVSNAISQASLEVNEEGSIASSLTSFSVVALSFSPPVPEIEFNCNRPFIAMIVNRDQKIPYFLAKISNPQ